ncbi:MAG TPA: hypothetical protein ACFCUC_02400 [Desulfobacterales bacterium]
MYGLEAISAHNGWAMAFAGALIVISGLAVLATVISQLHRVAALLERPRTKRRPDLEPPPPPKSPAPRASFSIETEIDRYRDLTEDLGDAFELQQLYHRAASEELPHVHLTIRSLREQGYLVADDKGLFSWKK